MSVASVGAGVGGAAKNSSGSPDDRDKSSTASAGSKVGAAVSAAKNSSGSPDDRDKSSNSSSSSSTSSVAKTGSSVGNSVSSNNNSVEGSGGGRGNGTGIASAVNVGNGVGNGGNNRNSSGSPDDRQRSDPVDPTSRSSYDQLRDMVDASATGSQSQSDLARGYIVQNLGTLLDIAAAQQKNKQNESPQMIVPSVADIYSGLISPQGGIYQPGLPVMLPPQGISAVKTDNGLWGDPGAQIQLAHGLSPTAPIVSEDHPLSNAVPAPVTDANSGVGSDPISQWLASLINGNSQSSGIAAAAGPTEAQLRAIREVTGADMTPRLPATPLNTNAAAPSVVADPALQYNDRAPSGEYTPSVAAINNELWGTPGAPINLANPIPPVQGSPGSGIPLSGSDPNSDLFASDGQVATPDGTVLKPGSVTTNNPAPAKASTWDTIVDNGGKLLSHTGIGSIVSTLFPDLWNSGGDMMKGLGDNASSGSGSILPYPVQQGDGNGDRGQTGAALQGFIDLNHNGIDDRLEGYVPPTTTPTSPTGGTPGTSTSNQYDRYGDVVFPTMPPYNPGVDNEWLYFRKKMVDGGMVGYADGGEVSPTAQADPRVAVIADAEDALHNAIGGGAQPADAAALQKFASMFGQDALRKLAANVQGGMKMRPRNGRLVRGPGGPKDDAIPAVITDRAGGQRPAALSDGEFVMPASAVHGAGDGDPAAGAERLQQLSQMLASKAA